MKRSRTEQSDEIHQSSIDIRRYSYPIKSQVPLECRVCGGTALGYNFDQITCESCKAFFRRHALKLEVKLLRSVQPIVIRVVFSRYCRVDSLVNARSPLKRVVIAHSVD